MTTTLFAAGCVDNSPPPPRVSVPLDASEGPLVRHDPVKPLPDPSEPRGDVPRPAYDDPALVDQELPELAAFLDAYDRVGRPAFAVEPARDTGIASDDAMILQLTDWLRAGGRVTMLAPGKSGGGTGSPDVRIKVAIDSIKDGSAKDARTAAVRASARAVNAGDNLLLGQTLVDIPAPVDRQAVNRFTRFMARKLMADMTQTWNASPPAEASSTGGTRTTPPPTGGSTPGIAIPPPTTRRGP